MPTIFAHYKPAYRVLSFAHSRQREIMERIGQLELESKLMQQVIDEFKPKVCTRCYGEGVVMIPIPGCECDGPRMHKCDLCNGTGERQHLIQPITLRPEPPPSTIRNEDSLLSKPPPGPPGKVIREGIEIVDSTNHGQINP